MKATAKRAVSASTADDRATQPRGGGTGVTEPDISRRAYDLYLARGREDGDDVGDWLQAEQALRQTAAHGE